MGSKTADYSTSSGEAIEAKLARLAKAKNEANNLYKNQQYSDAALAYTRLAADLLETDIKPSDVTQLVEAVKETVIHQQEARILLATLLCNTALCRFNLNMIDETESLCQACLEVDAYNYKAAYYLARCAVKQELYTTALKYVERCQNIVDAKKLDGNKPHPHIAIARQIRSCMNGTFPQKRKISTCEEILTNIEEGNATLLNLQKLNCHTKSEILKQRVIPRLLGIIKKKSTYNEYADVHAKIWSVIHQSLYMLDHKIEADMLAQVEAALEEYSVDLVRYTEEILDAIERDHATDTQLLDIVIQLSKCCADFRTLQSLETLTIMVERRKIDIGEHLLTSVWNYFTNMKNAEKTTVNAHFTNVLGNLMVALMEYYDFNYEMERREQLNGCLIAIFMRNFGKYEITEEIFTSMVTRVLNRYRSLGDSGIPGFRCISPSWYMGMKCLHMANREIFKAYVITNDIVDQLLTNVVSRNTNGSDPEVRLLVSEILALCMDFGECRQHLLNATVKDNSLLGILKNDTGFIEYLEEIKRRETELKEFCKQQQFEFHKTLIDNGNQRLYEHDMVVLSKLTVHSESVKKQLLDLFDLFYNVPRAMVLAIKDGHNPGALVDAMSYITLHEEAKSIDMINFVYVQLRWADSREQCKGTAMYMTCYTVTNLFRARKDRYGYNKETSINEMWDEDQMESLRKAFDKLPDASKATSNGDYNEGDVEKATEIREAVLTHNEDILRCLISIAKRIMKKQTGETGTDIRTASQLRPNMNAYMQIVEALHYLTLHATNRPLLQSAGVLRTLIDAANSDIYKGTNQRRYITQSIAHICIASNPQILSYRDALDATGPLVTLLDDNNELFQYEAALGLTNLLTINDDVRTRVWTINGWQALGNLLFSSNSKLKAACLEGWCNLAAGEDIVHHYFYKKIVQQMEAIENPSKVIALNIHDINILLLFAGDVTDLRCVIASTGALALLVRDLRIANYLPFFERIKNLFTVMDKLDNADVIYRVLTAFSCIIQGKVSKVSPSNETYVKEIKNQIQQCVRRNWTKYKTPVLLELAREVLDYKIH